MDGAEQGGRVATRCVAPRPVKAGTVKFRDRPDGNGGPAQTSAQKSLKSLPGSWVTRSRFANAPASLYATTG